MTTPTNPAPSPGPVVAPADAVAILDAQLLALIRQSLDIPLRALSDDGMAGPARQSVRLRDAVLPDGCPDSEDIYVGMGIDGQTLVDLGCNLGERARIAVRAGARLAAGIEHEELFVRIGGLINVYNRMHGIELRQGDITQPGCLSRDYDVATCFSAFARVADNIEEILARVRRLFILDTTTLDPRWYAGHIAVVRRFMPYWVIYDLTDHGGGRRHDRRASIAFGRGADAVRDIAGTRARELGRRNGNVVQLNLEDSPRITHLFGNPRRDTRPIYTKLRTAMAATAAPTPETLAVHLTMAVDDLRAAAPGDVQGGEAPGETAEGFGTDRYWQTCFEGLVQRIHDGTVTADNSYLRYLRHLSAIGRYDVHMQAVLANEANAIRRVAWRLDSILELLLTRAAPEQLPIVFNPMSPQAADAAGLSTNHLAAPFFVTDCNGERYLAPVIDGYHRMGMLYLSGVAAAPCMVVWTNLHPLNLRIGTAPLARGEPPELVSWDDPAVGHTIEGTVERLFPPVRGTLGPCGRRQAP